MDPHTHLRTVNFRCSASEALEIRQDSGKASPWKRKFPTQTCTR